MKVRLDYVTNSSSSSFIIACKSEKEMVKTINEELALYSDEVKNTIIEDARNGQGDVSEYIEEGEFSKVPTVNLVGVDNVNIDTVSEIKLTVTKDIPTNGDEVQEEVPQQ